MDQWLVYAAITVLYIIILVVYFIRRSRSHEQELAQFLQTAKQQVEEHKQTASQEANQKVVLAASVVKKVQQVAKEFETQAQKEYEQIIDEAKQERRELLAKARAEIEELFAQAEEDLKDYREKRYSEIEKNLVKLVIAVAERVVEVGFDEKQHKELIHRCLDEIAQQQQRS